MEVGVIPPPQFIGGGCKPSLKKKGSNTTFFLCILNYIFNIILYIIYFFERSLSGMKLAFKFKPNISKLQLNIINELSFHTTKLYNIINYDCLTDGAQSYYDMNTKTI